MKGQESQLCRLSKPCMAEGVGKSSRCDVEKDVINHDSHGNGNTSQGFINHGFILWNESRQQWVGNKRKSNQGDQNREPRLSWNSTYDGLLGSNKPFDKPVPLSEMVDFLVDVWEQDGMYD